jgi:hypothetical protein
MSFIKRMLHDPDSAEFGQSDKATVSIKGNRAMVIRSVRATNGFGAKRLEDFICFMELQNGVIQPALIAQQGDNPDQIKQLLKQWGMP